AQTNRYPCGVGHNPCGRQTLLEAERSSRRGLFFCLRRPMSRYGRDRTRKTRTIWVQPRDLEMLRSIGTARLLTAQALDWLHFNGWRDRYKEALAAARASNKSLIYYPARRLYTRLAGLEQHGLILRISRTTEQGILQFRALPDGFALTTAGAGLL